MLRNKPFSFPALMIVLLAAALPAFAQRDLPEIKPKAKTNVVRTRKITKSQRAVVRSNGVLFVLTDPDTADIIIKDSRGTVVERAKNRDGEFRKELPSGSYEVEVKAENYRTYTEKNVVVKPASSEIVRAELPPTTGSIILALGNVDPNLNVLLDGKKPDKVTHNKKNNTLEIDEVSAGNHDLKLTHPSIVDYENPIAVLAGADSILSPRFERAVVNLTVRSEPGASVYVDDAYRGEVGGNREIPITGLAPGEHRVRAEKERFQTAGQTKSFTPGSHVLDLPLKRVVFSGEFTDNFPGGAAGAWDRPVSWKTQPGKLLVQGVRGKVDVGLVKDKVYEDFKMEFDISFNNAKGAAWVVRAQNKQNYYLFQLSGPSGLNPNTFTGYVCRDGRLEPLGPPVRVIEPLGTPGEQFHIIVDAKGPNINHSIIVGSNPTPEPQPLGGVTDSTFATGTVGFATKDEEAFTVFTVTVMPSQQASPR